MNMRTATILIVLLALAAGLPAAIDTAFLGKAAVSAREGPEFPEGPMCDVTIRSARPASQQIVLGEPLVIEVRLKGASLGEPQPHSFSTRLGQDIRVYVTPENRRLGGTAEIAPHRGSPLGALNSVTLKLGQVLDFPIICAHDPNTRSGAAFDAPGRYLVQVRMNCPKKDVKTGNYWEDAGIFVIEVLPPAEGSDDKTAWELMTPYDSYTALQSLIVSKREHLAILEKIVATAPKARIRPFALMALAQTSYADYAVDPKQLDRCVAFLTMLLDNHPDSILATQAAELLVDALLAKGDETAAHTAFVDRIWTDPRTMRDMLPGNPLILTFVGEPQPAVTGDWMVFMRPIDAMIPQRSETDELIRQALGDEMADRLGEPVRIQEH